MYGLLLVIVLLVVTAIAAMAYIHTLSSHIAELEIQNTTIKTQLSSYQRSLCSNASNSIMQSNQLTKYYVISGGYARTYQVYTPNNYDPSVRYPVVISFDGIEGSGSRMEAYSGLDALPVILAYPDPLLGKQGFTSWGGAPYSVAGERDVQFVRTLLDAMPASYCTDTTRTCTVGMSNGGSLLLWAVGLETKSVQSLVYLGHITKLVSS